MNIPLSNSIGYEFSLINGFFLFVFSLFVTKPIFKKNNYGSFTTFLFENQFLFIIIFLLPLIIAFLSTFLFTKCPLTMGLKFYFYITFFSFLYGLFISFLSNQTFKKFPNFVFLSLLTLFIILGFLEFYFYPQVYSFNPVYGFINGTIYDEDPKLSNDILYFHFYTIVNFVFINYFIKILMNKNIHRIKIYFVLIFILIISFTLKPYLGFATNKNILENKLSSEIETNNFKIIIDKNISNDKKRNIALLHEYYFEQVCSALKIKFNKKITSFVFKDKIQKGELFGSSSADIAKPWLCEIYVSSNTLFETLKHEIVHVVSSEFGKSIFKIAKNLNPTLTEGLAMFVENEFDGYEIDYVAFLFLKSKPKYKIENLFFKSSFFSSYSAISYVLAGSFLNFISNKYGIEKVKEIYGNNNFDSLNKASFDVLKREYLSYLDSKGYPYNKFKAQLYFGGKSIVEKYCPRNAASDLSKANILYSQKNFNEAAILYYKIYGYSKNYHSLSGFIKSKLMINEFESALMILQKEIEKFSDDQFYFNLELLLSECYLANNKFKQSIDILNKIIEQNPNYNYTNEAKFRLLLINNLGRESYSYHKKNNFEKYQILTSIYSKEKNELVLMRLIYLSKLLKKDYSQILNNVYFEKNLNGFYTNLELSKFYFNESNYDLSKKFVIDALKIDVPNIEKYKAIEYLKMINWIVNYKDEILIKIRE